MSWLDPTEPDRGAAEDDATEQDEPLFRRALEAVLDIGFGIGLILGVPLALAAFWILVASILAGEFTIPVVSDCTPPYESSGC